MTLPRQARLYLWLVAGAAIAAFGLAYNLDASGWSVIPGRAVPLSAADRIALAQLVVLAVVAQHFPLGLGPQRKFDLSLAAHLAILLLAEMPRALALVAAAEAMGHATLMLRRNPKTGRRRRGIYSAVFNTSQFIVAAAAAGIAGTGVGNAVAGVVRRDGAGSGSIQEALPAAAAVLAAGAVLYLANTALVATMAALHQRISPWHIWREGRARHALFAAGLLTLGALVAHAATQSPWVPLVMALPAGLTYFSLRRTAEIEAQMRLRDEFLGIAAHELRTPLTTLRGYTQLLVSQCERGTALDTARLERSLRTIDRQSGKLNDLVDQLLDVTRLQAGKLGLEKQGLDLSELAREVVVALQPLTPAYTLTVKAPDSVYVAADRLRLEQVLINLITNAARHAGRGNQIEVEVGGGDAAGTATLAVRDFGVGIAPEHRTRIFEQFYQAGAGSKAGGLGIGLYVTRQIVELHGGRITVECPRSGGTRFHITLPKGAESVRFPAGVGEALPHSTQTPQRPQTATA